MVAERTGREFEGVCGGRPWGVTAFKCSAAAQDGLL